MKKTNSMRVAVAMLALTLITSCFVGGTFAKYTTSASGVDSARVAKFGVVIDASKSAFLDKYETTDTEYTGQYTVQSAEVGENVVAPGTKGEIDLFSITGTPEVAVRIDVKMDDIKSIYLQKKTRTIYVVVDTEGWNEVFYILGMNGQQPIEIPAPEEQDKLKDLYEQRERDLANDSWLVGNPIQKIEYEGYDYYPIKWTLEKDGTTLEIDGTKLADVKAYIDEHINIECAPGTDLSKIGGTYKLKWEWAFDGSDEDDTLLGDLSAGTVTLSEDEYEYSTNESFKFTITVTQID